MPEYTNPVPLGQAGTGGAFLLPGSTALDRLIGTIDSNNNIRQQRIDAQNKAAQALAKSYQTNRLKATNGMLWNPELQKLDAAHMKQGLDYYQQGFDPFNPNPNDAQQMKSAEQYQTDRAKLLSLHDARKATETAWLAQDKSLKEAPDGTYDPESINAFHNFTSLPLQQIVDGNIQIPTVQKTFNESDFLSKLHPTSVSQKVVGKNGVETSSTVPDMESIRKTVANSYLTNPQAAKQFQKATGVAINAIPATDDPKKLDSLVNDFYRSADGISELKNVPEIQQMAQKGESIYDSDLYKNLVKTKVQQYTDNFKKANTYIDEKARAVAARVDEKHAKGYNFAYLNHQLALDKNSRERTKFGQEQTDRNSQASYNVPGYVANTPAATGHSPSPNAVTVPAEIDGGDIKGAVVPKEVWNPTTGHFGANTAARNIVDAKIRLMPMLETKGKKGETIKTFLSDDDIAKIQNGTYTTKGVKPSYADVKYKYMVYGSEKKKIPQMEDDEDNPGKKIQAKDGNGNGKFIVQDLPVAFDAEHLTDDKFTKKVNYDQVEVKLDQPVQLKIISDRVSKRNPNLTPEQHNAIVAEFYNSRLKKYNKE